MAKKVKLKSLKPRVRRPKRSRKAPKLWAKTKKGIRPTMAGWKAHCEELEGKVASHEVTIRNQKENYTNLYKQFEQLKNPFWKMGNGQLVSMSEMEESHLRNAISYCARRLVLRLSNAVWLEETNSLVEGLANMLKEAKRRGIRV